MITRLQTAEVEIDGLCGGAGAPTATGVVAARHAVPEITAYGVPFAIAATVATPRSVCECRFPINQDGVGLGRELVATVPATMAGTDVTQAHFLIFICNIEAGSQTVCSEQFSIASSSPAFCKRE